MKVVICGAGIAGLALAQRLDTLGGDVVVLEPGH
ncbi:NAD(P)-binding protein [Streptomyces sp. NPDC057743]